MEPELARQLVAKTDGAADDIARGRIQSAFGARAAVTGRTDETPATVRLPARFDFDRGHLVTLVAHCRDSAQLDVGTQEKWRFVRCPLVVAPDAERPSFRQ